MCENERELRAGEDGGEVATIGTVGVVDVSQTDLGVIRAQDIVSVGCAVHPPGDRLQRGIGVVAGGEDVFADPAEAISLITDPIGGS